MARQVTVDSSQLAVEEKTEESPHVVAPLEDRGEPDAGHQGWVRQVFTKEGQGEVQDRWA